MLVTGGHPFRGACLWWFFGDDITEGTVDLIDLKQSFICCNNFLSGAKCEVRYAFDVNGPRTSHAMLCV